LFRATYAPASYNPNSGYRGGLRRKLQVARKAQHRILQPNRNIKTIFGQQPENQIKGSKVHFHHDIAARPVSTEREGSGNRRRKYSEFRTSALTLSGLTRFVGVAGANIASSRKFRVHSAAAAVAPVTATQSTAIQAPRLRNAAIRRAGGASRIGPTGSSDLDRGSPLFTTRRSPLARDSESGFEKKNGGLKHGPILPA